MKSVHRILSGLLLVALLLGPSASQVQSYAALNVSQAAAEPWINKVFYAGTYSGKNLSTAFAGPLDIPIISSASASTTWVITLAHRDPDGLGGCGPGNTWSCDLLGDSLTNPDKVSDVATYYGDTTILVGWAYVSTVGSLYIISKEYDFNFSPVGSAEKKIVFIPDHYQETIKGRPSLAFDPDGEPRMAFVLRNDMMLSDSLVHVEYTGSNNTSCRTTTQFECITIDGSDSFYGEPLIGVNSAGASRIAYLDAYADKLYFAYPQSSTLYHPNCGPGGNTWRCVVIADGAGGTLGPALDMAAGAGITDSQPFRIAYTFKGDLLGQPQLMYADYVSSGGNCGEDYGPSYPAPTLRMRWQCNSLYTYDDYSTFTNVWFSLQVDENDYPVIAYNDDDPNNDIHVMFPAARAGGALEGNCLGNEWYCTEIFNAGAPAGRDISLALSSSGLGFLAFVEDREYEPYLWISQQFFHLYLPTVTK